MCTTSPRTSARIDSPNATAAARTKRFGPVRTDMTIQGANPTKGFDSALRRALESIDATIPALARPVPPR